MIDDVFVIDAVAHGYNLGPANQVDPGYAAATGAQLYGLAMQFVPEGYLLPYEEWSNSADPDLVASALFAESPTDFAIYHQVPMFGAFKDGSSPIWVGQNMRERWPGRVALFAGVSPFLPDPVGQVDRAIDEYGAIGLKLYPLELIEGHVNPFPLDDPEIAYPIYQRAVDRGIKTIAVHKALPLGPVPLDPFRVADVEAAAIAFPQLMFQIVHGGMAFVEETALQLARFPNISVNLEGTTVLAVKAPRQFATIVGSFLQLGAADRILWATGCMAIHPRPFLEAFWRMEMPRDLVEEYGMPELTRDIKAQILGANAARICGIDIDAERAKASGDQYSTSSEPRPPWSTRDLTGASA
jgi:uncharacterized protein